MARRSPRFRSPWYAEPMQKKLFQLPPPVHGGDLFPHQRKRRRPFAPNRPIHTVLKAEREFGAYRGFVLLEAERLVNHFGLVMLDNAIALDHLHLALAARKQSDLSAFLRTLSGLVARKLGKGIWDQPPFTRVLGWGRELEILSAYFWRNRMEAAGGMRYEPRKDYYEEWRA